MVWGLQQQGDRPVVTEYSDAKSKSNETNPLRLSSFFYLVVGSINLLAGGAIAFLLTRETQSLAPAVLPTLGIAATLLVLGLTQVSRTWRDEKFRFHPDDIGGFAVPEKLVKNGTPDQAAHVIDILNNGVQPLRTPDNALLNKLYNMLPRLELAPELIRWHAETQALRIAKLVVVTLGFLLAWLFAKPVVFAWMAPVYLFLAINPLAILRTVSRGGAGDVQLARPAAPTATESVGILLFSIFGPVLLGLLPPGTLSSAPYATSTVVIPTVTAMVSLLLASTLFILSIKMQTRELTQSGVSHQVRKDLSIPNLSSGLIDRLESDLPFPRTVLSRNTGWQRDGNFGASLLVETEPKLNTTRSQGTLMEALGMAWRDNEQRALVALGLAGVVTGLLASGLAFVFTRNSSLAFGLTALSLFSASQFSLFAARGMWNRVEFTSTVYRILYKGSFRQAQRTAGNSVTGTGTLTESTTRIEHVDFWVCVARLQSVSFARKGLRYIQSVDLKPQECEQQFGRIEDFYRDVMQRKVQAYSEEGMVRQLVHGHPAAQSPDQAAAFPALQMSPERIDTAAVELQTKGDAAN